MRPVQAWLASTRPDLTLKISQIAHLTRFMFEQDSSKRRRRLNQVIKNTHDIRACISISKLAPNTVCIVAYCDAAFPNKFSLILRLVQKSFSQICPAKRFQSHIDRDVFTLCVTGREQLLLHTSLTIYLQLERKIIYLETSSTSLYLYRHQKSFRHKI